MRPTIVVLSENLMIHGVHTGVVGPFVAQQSEQHWAQHTPLGGTSVHHGAADLDCLGASQ